MPTNCYRGAQTGANACHQPDEVFFILSFSDFYPHSKTLLSVVGMIAIPGTMTGAILGGASAQQAAKLQMIVMFMISSSTCLATVFTTIAVIAVTLDSEHRIRMDRVDCRKHGIWRARELASTALMLSFKRLVCGWREKDLKLLSERTPLLIGEQAPMSKVFHTKSMLFVKSHAYSILSNRVGTKAARKPRLALL